ncbi:hypothetical protein QTP88_021128 [Uroleucon formosanum]
MKKSLTASLFGRICKLRKTKSRNKVVSSILFGTFKGNASTRYAVSPDVLVELDALVEIKCPASAKDFTPEDAIKNKKIKSCVIKNGNLFLNRNDNYYYQIQGQLHVTNRMYCYFCIWTPKGLLFEKIQSFLENNTEVQLKTFFMDYLLKDMLKAPPDPALQTCHNLEVSAKVINNEDDMFDLPSVSHQQMQLISSNENSGYTT